jgi:predicted  nucleic acid-binding Zn-ribbon protein
VDLARTKLEDAGVDVGPASATDEAARAELEVAAQDGETEVQAANEDLQTLVDGVATLTSELAAIKEQLATAKANQKNAEDTASQIRETLDVEIARDGDDAVLDSAIGEAAIKVQAAAREVANIDEQLADGALDGARQDLEDAQRAVETNAAEIKRLDNRVSELAGQIRETNMVGIHERIAEAVEAKDHADRTLARVEIEATAARLLFETLTRHKSETEQRFRAPLEKSIQTLVRLLWPDARITLDDCFQIEAIERPKKLGRDDFEALSAGASEQLGLVARLAMAQILADQQPLLVLLDDSLVVTDDDRFKDMARVINRVADKMQIIFLTCHWNRQSGLGLSPHNVIDMEDLVSSAAVQPAG